MEVFHVGHSVRKLSDSVSEKLKWKPNFSDHFETKFSLVRQDTAISWATNSFLPYALMKIWKNLSVTCIHVSSVNRSGDVSGDWRGGGNGWISLGTTTNPLPITNIAPALFAVPECICSIRLCFKLQKKKGQKKLKIITAYHNSWLQKIKWLTGPEQIVQIHP